MKKKEKEQSLDELLVEIGRSSLSIFFLHDIN